MLKDIRIVPDNVLRKKSTPVETIDDTVRKLVNDMFDTMYNAPGIGLAAVQIGICKRILVMDVSTEKQTNEPITMINPIIHGFSDEVDEAQEGCLSLPGITEQIKRYLACDVSYIDYYGNEKKLYCEGLLARCVQHEIDHLNGILMIDHLSRLKRGRLLKKYEQSRLKQDKERSDTCV